MEDTLRVEIVVISSLTGISLNPYSNGRYSERVKLKKLRKLS